MSTFNEEIIQACLSNKVLEQLFFHSCCATVLSLAFFMHYLEDKSEIERDEILQQAEKIQAYFYSKIKSDTSDLADPFKTVQLAKKFFDVLPALPESSSSVHDLDTLEPAKMYIVVINAHAHMVYNNLIYIPYYGSHEIRPLEEYINSNGNRLIEYCFEVSNFHCTDELFNSWVDSNEAAEDVSSVSYLPSAQDLSQPDMLFTPLSIKREAQNHSLTIL